MGQWQIVFFIAAGIYIASATFYILFGSGERQAWDNPLNDEPSTGGVPIHQLNGIQHSNNLPTTITANTVIPYQQSTLHSNGQTEMNGNGAHETIH